MKKKFIKIATCAVMLVVTMFAMVVPSMAAEPSSFVFVQFENPDHAEYVSYKQSDAFTYDAATGRVSSTGLGTSDFFLSLQNSVSPKSGCYYFSLGLWCASPDEALDFRFTYRYDGWECTLFTSSDGILMQSGKAVCDFTEGTVFYLSCFIDANGQKAYYSVVDENGDGLTPFTMIDLAAIGQVSVFSSDRLLYIYSSAKTSTEYCVFSDITVYEVPSSTLKAFGETALGGYDDGYTDGYTDGSNDGWDSCVNDLYDTVYNEGYAAGKDEGLTEGYQHGYIDGDEIGYNRGYNDGTSDGYSWGYIDGEDIGLINGYKDGYGNGRTDGLAEGYANGLTDGYNNGYNVGLVERQDYWYDQGHIAGYDKGLKEYYNGIYEDALDKISPSEGTGVQGFLAGMWSGTQGFMQELLDGITFSGLSLRSIVTTCLAIAMAAFLIRLLKG